MKSVRGRSRTTNEKNGRSKTRDVKSLRGSVSRGVTSSLSSLMQKKIKLVQIEPTSVVRNSNSYRANSPKSGSSKAGSSNAASPRAGSSRANTPRANSPKAASPKAGSSRANSPKAASPKAGSPRAGSPKAGSPRANSPKEEISDHNKYLRYLRNQIFGGNNVSREVIRHLNLKNVAKLAMASKSVPIAKRRLEKEKIVYDVTKQLLWQRLRILHLPRKYKYSPRKYEPTILAIVRQYKTKKKNGRNIVNNDSNEATIKKTINPMLDSIEKLREASWKLKDPFRPTTDEKNKFEYRVFQAPVNKNVRDARMTVFSEAISSGALASLKRLLLVHIQISDNGMKAFSSAISSGALASLQILWLNSNQIGDEGMKAFSGALSTGALASLKELILSENQIGDEGMKAFSSALSSGALASLERLYLFDNQIGDEGMKAFSSALSSGGLGSLQELALDNNIIGDAGMIAFSQALEPKSNFPKVALASLQYLGLGANQISEEGMKAFSTALSSGALTTLQTLALGRNRIGDEGMKAFSTALFSRKLAKLTKLWLNSNQIGDEGMEAFSNPLSSGSLPSLGLLNLNDNKIGIHGIRDLLIGIQNSPHSNKIELLFQGNPGAVLMKNSTSLAPSMKNSRGIASGFIINKSTVASVLQGPVMQQLAS